MYPKTKRVVDRGTVLWAKNRRDGVCMWHLETKEKCFGGLDPHHIKSKSTGGGDVERNIITLCRGHHADAQERRIPANDLRAILTKRYGYEYSEQELTNK